MNAREVLRLAHNHGVRIRVEDGALVLEADREPDAHVLDMLGQYKGEVIALLTTPESVDDEPFASGHGCPICRGIYIVTDAVGPYCIDCRKHVAR